MAIPLYSKLLWPLANVGTADSPYVFTPVPDGYVWVVRTITWGTHGTEGAVGNLYLVDPTDIAYDFAFFDTGTTGDSIATSVWNGRMVVPAGWNFQLVVRFGVGSLLVSGYQLTSP